MGEGGGIDDDAGGALASAMNPVDDLVFAIALMKLDRKPKLTADTAAVRFDVGQRLAAIDLRLAHAEQVEIRAVQDHDDRTHALPPTSRHREERSDVAIQRAVERPITPGLLRSRSQ